MREPSRETIARLKEEYQKGTRVELVQMDDVQAPPIGTLGTVMGVDDMGTIHVAWDNGSSLGAVYGEDIIRKVSKVCPVCGKAYSGYPALSRKDNKTEICPECGLKEALLAANALKN